MRVTHRRGRRRSTGLIGIVVAVGCANNVVTEVMMMIVVRLDRPKPSKRGTLWSISFLMIFVSDAQGLIICTGIWSPLEATIWRRDDDDEYRFPGDPDH